MEPITTIAGTAMVTEAVKHLTNRLLSTHWSPDLEPGQRLILQLSEGFAHSEFSNKYVAKFLKMRTLHSPESDVYLQDIYTPLRLKTVSNENEISIDDGVVLQSPGILNIIGIAGQGKSTILRKLFWEEIKASKRIPFIIELRKVETTILDYFIDCLKDVGLSIADGDAEILLQSKKVVLMLDGFDEVAMGKRSRFLIEINQLNTRHRCSIITTTRPGTEICHEVGIKSLSVQKLNLKEIISILNKLDISSNFDEIPALIKGNHVLQDTLVSPILVNLLFVCYPYLDAVPETVVDFYRGLFSTLYSRHDKIKNYVREKCSSISTDQAFEIFNAVSFNSLNRGDGDFTQRLLSQYTRSAMKLVHVDEEYKEQVLEDIINITCLIQADGHDKFVYLHKSVQEFHAAQFLADSRHDRKQKFYSHIVEHIDIEQKWDNVVTFLSQIDHDDYVEMLLLKKCREEHLHHLNQNKEAVLERLIENILSQKSVSFEYIASSGRLHFLRGDTLESNIALSSINLLWSGQRLGGVYDIEQPFNDSITLFNSVMAGLTDFATADEMIHKILSFSQSEILQTESVQTVTISLKDFLVCSCQIENLELVIENYVMEFYTKCYLPIEKANSDIDRVLDLEFNMI